MWSFYTAIKHGTLWTRGIQMMSSHSQFVEIQESFNEGLGIDCDVPGRLWMFSARSDTEMPFKERLQLHSEHGSFENLHEARNSLIQEWLELGLRHVVDCPIEEMQEPGYASYSREVIKKNGGQVVLVGQTINNYLTYQLQHKLGTGMVIDGLKALSSQVIWDRCCKQIDWAKDVVSYDDFPKNCAFHLDGREMMGSLDEALQARLDVMLNKLTLADYRFSENDISPIW